MVSRLRCEVTAHRGSGLAQYNSALLQKKHSLFESCLIELVRHLDDAPFLQTLQVFNGFIFERHSISHVKIPELHFYKSYLI